MSGGAVPMPEFLLTFGQQYARDLHPTFDLAHPDGWVTIVAEDYRTARKCAVENFERWWSDLYPAEDVTFAHLFPRGEIARFTRLPDAVRTDPWIWYCRICGATGADGDPEARDQAGLNHVNRECTCSDRPNLCQSEHGRLLHLWRY